jgi:hypothetical protein
VLLLLLPQAPLSGSGGVVFPSASADASSFSAGLPRGNDAATARPRATKSPQPRTGEEALSPLPLPPLPPLWLLLPPPAAAGCARAVSAAGTSRAMRASSEAHLNAGGLARMRALSAAMLASSPSVPPLLLVILGVLGFGSRYKK